jgi:hypothetical protein
MRLSGEFDASVVFFPKERSISRLNIKLDLRAFLEALKMGYFATVGNYLDVLA